MNSTEPGSESEDVGHVFYQSFTLSDIKLMYQQATIPTSISQHDIYPWHNIYIYNIYTNA